MNYKYWWVLLAFSASAQAIELAPEAQQTKTAYLAAAVLSKFHYKASLLDDSLSAKIFERYLKSLDGDKMFFTQGDIDAISGARNRLDDAIIHEDLSLPFAIFNLYTQRVTERFNYAKGLLHGTPPDFTAKDSFQFSRENETWSPSEEALRSLWSKRVKNDWLRLKLAGKADNAIIETLDKRYEASIKRMEKLKSDDAFQIFMNAYTTSLDPHTNYLSPRTSENFEISMKLSLVGIGAILEEKDEYTTIRELVAGGPAALSGKLKVGDRIVGVAQGREAASTDVQGWRLDDTVRLIRGQENTLVVLDILPANASPDEPHRKIELTRKKITLSEQAAKQSVIKLGEGKSARKIGVITLPSFYRDFAGSQKGEADFKSATKDVARILEALKKEKVDSLLIDLRGNGGGSLTEAVDLTGLFIDRGPVVQQRDARGKISVENDTRAGVAWSGPLGVLINRESASASEIFAAAIQDYGRGLIIGEPSFGKGTVQSMISLDRLANNDKQQFGDLKMTVAQFFRINGDTTQLRGVIPDIKFQTSSDAEKFGESALPNALPWSATGTAAYQASANLAPIIPALRERHLKRIAQNAAFQALQDEIKSVEAIRKKNLISLNEEERRQERAQQDAQRAKRKQANNAILAADDGLLSDERPSEENEKLIKESKAQKDVVLDEAANILLDELSLQSAPPEAAARTAAKLQGGAHGQPAL